MFLDQIDHQVAETIIGYLEASDASVRVAQLRVLGGAMARVPVEATAFAHRRSAIMATVASFYDGAADKPVRQAWVDEFAAALQQRMTAPTLASSPTQTPAASAGPIRGRRGPAGPG